MFTLLESITHFEVTGLADGLDDRESQAVGVLFSTSATIEAVEESLGIQCFAITCVGNT